MEIAILILLTTMMIACYMLGSLISFLGFQMKLLELHEENRKFARELIKLNVEKAECKAKRHEEIREVTDRTVDMLWKAANDQ